MTPDAAVAESRYRALADEAEKNYERFLDDEASTVMVGCATCGVSAGAEPVVAAFEEAFTEAGIAGRVVRVGCMGHCYAEPMALLKRPGFPALVYHHLNPIIAGNLVRTYFGEGDPLLEYVLGATGPNEMMLPTLSDLPRYGGEHRRLLRRSGLHDPEDIHQAIALGVYAGVSRAMDLGPAGVIEALRDSGLRGMGGAGFPTWRKWELCYESPETTRYLICNADEGDPGAFMDRTILESDPHAVLEGMLIAGLTIGARHGIVYVRNEYPRAVARMRTAVEQARGLGLLGDDVLGAGVSFDVEVFEGAGAFVCGEETALIASIEGYRGTARVRPPYPAERGLYGKPTVLDNVKSLASLGPILVRGSERFARIGTESSKGTAVFALAGKIANPGLVEVPMGTTLRQVIFDIGGGVPDGKKFKAVQIGGPSGGCLPESLLDTPIDFDSLSEVGAMMGSGGMVVLDEDNCMVETARFFLEFTRNESCGKCTFCRIGTSHMLDLLTDITGGRGTPEHLEQLRELASQVRDGSLCNLGKTAPNPVLTTLRFFPEEYEEHIHQLKCRARVCKELTSYFILPDKCARGCDACVGSCPPEAIFTSPKRRIKVVDQQECIKCDSCMSACPPEYDAVVKISPVRDTPPSEPRPAAKTTDETGGAP